MEESFNKDKGNTYNTELYTFSVPSSLGGDKENFITTNYFSNFSIDKIINQAIELHIQGNISEAEKYYQQCISIGCNDHRVFSNFGSILKETGRLKEAEFSLRKAIEIKPDYAIAYSNLGTILSDLGKLKESEVSLRKAIEINPDYAIAYSKLGSVLNEVGKYNEAECLLRRSIEINPNCANAFCILGTILINYGKFEEAKLVTNKAMEIEPTLAKAHLNLGICQLALGNINHSLNALNIAYEIDSKDIQIKSLIAILNGKYRVNLENSVDKTRNNDYIDEKTSWNPIVLNRVVEEKLIEKLYTIKTQEASFQNRYPRPIFGNIKGSDYDLFEHDISIIKDFKVDLVRLISDYFKSEIYITESFFNIISPKESVGGGNKIHNHLSRIDKIPRLNIYKQKYSLVYYLSIGDQDCQDKGMLKFHKPDKDFLPEKGMIVVFPASKLHSVSYNGNEDRISIVVNFYVV